MSLTVKKAKEFLESKGYSVISPSDKRAGAKAKEMYDSYKRNHGNMAAVAREFKISRERVRQILSKHYDLKGTGVRDNTERIREIRESFVKHGCDVTKTAKELGLTAWYVTIVRKEYFPELIPAPIPKKEDSLTDEKIKELYEKHDGNIRRVAQQLGKHPVGIYDRCIALGLRGQGHFKATNNEVIAAMKKAKGNKAAAARDLGMTPAGVYNRLKKMTQDGVIDIDVDWTSENDA